ncbi:MAG: DUF975 family protein [Lachnospiraceae bacterium]|nr:DUF975 family protein [Lachnospiraceae bacterium]
MWTRKELKEKGNTSFKKNYWKAVLVGLIVTIIGGGFSGGYSYNSSLPASIENRINTSSDSEEKKESAKSEEKKEKKDNKDEIEINVDDIDDLDEAIEQISGAVDDISTDMEESGLALTGFVFIMFIIFLVIMGVALVIGFALSAFLLNPLEMGCDRFFFKNLSSPAEIAKNVLFAFDNSYKNIVKTLFFRDLYTFLWGLLFVIPGIVKSYEYRMLPYILAENPDMDTKEAFALTKEMMRGQKWKAFVLDLSFIGWDILSIFTCGILSIFYVNPYRNATKAALYEALKTDKTDDIDNSVEMITEATDEL